MIEKFREALSLFLVQVIILKQLLLSSERWEKRSAVSVRDALGVKPMPCLCCQRPTVGAAEGGLSRSRCDCFGHFGLLAILVLWFRRTCMRHVLCCRLDQVGSPCGTLARGHFGTKTFEKGMGLFSRVMSIFEKPKHDAAAAASPPMESSVEPTPIAERRRAVGQIGHPDLSPPSPAFFQLAQEKATVAQSRMALSRRGGTRQSTMSGMAATTIQSGI